MFNNIEGFTWHNQTMAKQQKQTQLRRATKATELYNIKKFKT
jgi:hypothetical protein